MTVTKTFGCVVAALASVALPAIASATNYTFDVLYTGGDTAVLAAGSADPLTTTLFAGDSFTYSLSANGLGTWKALTGASIFPLFALAVTESDTRTGSYTLTLSNSGVAVFSLSEAVSNSYAHLGTNSVAVPQGLTWDTYSLSYAIDTAAGGSTAYTLLPWPNLAPQNYTPGNISFSADVPEPASWMMMIGGFGMVGGALRSRRKAAVRFA